MASPERFASFSSEPAKLHSCNCSLPYGPACLARLSLGPWSLQCVGMEPEQILIVAVILTGGVTLQGIVGFGTGMFSVPLMLLFGIELPVAISALLAAVTLQTAYSTWRYREYVPWEMTARMTMWRYLALPAGVYALTFLADAGINRAKQVVGIVLLLVILLQFALRIKPRPRLHPLWAPLAGAASGFMGGAFGMGGSPLVLWTMAHDWPSRKSRAFLWSTFMLLMPPQLALLIYAFGWKAGVYFTVGLALGPVLLAAASAGAWLGDRLNRRRLRVIAFAFLMIIAFSAILQPLL